MMDIDEKTAHEITLDFSGGEDIGNLIARSLVCENCSKIIKIHNAKRGNA